LALPTPICGLGLFIKVALLIFWFVRIMDVVVVIGIIEDVDFVIDVIVMGMGLQ